jgi:uncharacterized protein (TIGR02466 family)
MMRWAAAGTAWTKEAIPSSIRRDLIGDIHILPIGVPVEGFAFGSDNGGGFGMLRAATEFLPIWALLLQRLLTQHKAGMRRLMAVQHLFPTALWQSKLDDAALLDDLAASAHQLEVDDAAGRRWSRAHSYQGYTSYGSLNDLPVRDPTFASLARWLQRQATAFAVAAHLDLAGRKPKLDSLWVNILKPGGGHSGHIHPHSIISGTVYIKVPPGSGSIRFEDPRLPMLMRAPLRTVHAPAEHRNFVHIEPAAGDLLLWESWLRHEVMPSAAKQDRVSISFNFA